MLDTRAFWRIFGAVCVALGLMCGPAHARGGKATPQLLIEQPEEGDFVGAKFKVEGRVTFAPKGTIVRMGDQKATVGPEGEFELDTVSTSEGKRDLRVTCTVGGKTLSDTRTVTADLTAPVFTEVIPAEEAAEFDTPDVVVSGRLVDAAPLTLRVGREVVALEPDGRFRLHYYRAVGDKFNVSLVATDAAGNASRIVRRLQRVTDKRGPAIRIRGRSAGWIARDGTVIPIPFDPKAGAAAILAHESAGPPLTDGHRPLIVRLESSVSRYVAFWPLIDTLSALGMPVALAPHPPEERRRHWPVDTLLLKRSHDGPGQTVGWSLRMTREADARTWFLSDVAVASFSAPGESPEGRALAALLDELAADRKGKRSVPTIRIVSSEAVDVRLLRALGKPAFRVDDVIFVDSERVAGDPMPSTGLIGVGGGGDPPAVARDRENVAAAIERGVSWLSSHQRPDGSWGAADWQQWCDFERNPARADLDGSGKTVVFDIGVTGLALLALLDANELGRSDPTIVQTVAAGVKYLVGKQDAAGRFGSKAPEQSVYNHAIASQAVIRAFGASGNPTWKDSAQRAMKVIEDLQVPGSGWGYGDKTGPCNTSVTGWMSMALVSGARVAAQDELSGRRGSLRVAFDTEAGIVAWLDEVTDPVTGRVGYSKRGAGPDRAPERVAAFPVAQSEALTALGLLARVGWLPETPETRALVRKGSALCSALPPVWDPKRGSIDMCYWYFGTQAMVEIGGAERRAWESALVPAIVGSQRSDGIVCTYLGSWDPIDPWGADGGRVYSTALMTMCLAHWYDHEGLVRPWNR